MEGAEGLDDHRAPFGRVFTPLDGFQKPPVFNRLETKR
jgi:hypothetical protein